MRWSEILSHLNQIGIGPVSFGWVSIEADHVRARKIIRFLEDRRMLFNDCADEDIGHCIISAEEIRKRMTAELEDLPESSALLPHLRAMRTSARRFMDRFPQGSYRHFNRDDLPLQRMAVYIYLGQLRSEVGFQVALLASRWQIDVEDDLARVLPKID